MKATKLQHLLLKGNPSQLVIMIQFLIGLGVFHIDSFSPNLKDMPFIWSVQG